MAERVSAFRASTRRSAVNSGLPRVLHGQSWNPNLNLNR